jgi:predicted ATPase/transcriptional regulator with XRE-family HTH domain
MAEDRTADFAEVLRRARRASGLSQEELAERAGLSAHAISALERGVNRAPRPDTLDMLADALALPADERRRWERLRRQQASRAPAEVARDTAPRGSTPPTNLPVQPTRFIGRVAELERIGQLMRDDTTRLVTLTGPGGSGKTRLAVEMAAGLRHVYPDGVFFVDLAPVSAPELALATLAATLGVYPRPDQALSTTLGQWLVDKRLLLVLDNLEQVLAVAPDIAELLRTCPDLRILATSRAPLRLRAEREFPVPPLPVPPSEAGPDARDTAESDAVRLFVDRARAVQPTFDAQGEDALVVGRICRLLDGLPLAIELAAAGVRLLPPPAILARLEQHLPLVGSGQRDVPARQRTLHNTIAWSYDLLTVPEQALLRRLSLFQGGWTLEAAEAVAAGESGTTALGVLEGLDALVEHNLIQMRAWVDGSPRFTMLETIREFGSARLADDEAREAIRQRHAEYFATLFDGSEGAWHTREAEAWLRRGAAEIENVRVALTWAIDHDPLTALHLAREMSWIWVMLGALHEGQEWIERALANAGDVSDQQRAGALYWIGHHATTFGDYTTARATLEEALAIYLDLGDAISEARCLFCLGRIGTFGEDAARAVALYESAESVFRQYHDPQLTVTLSNLGGDLLEIGEFERAAAVLDEALALAEQDGLDWHRAQILELQGLLGLTGGDVALARQALHRCLQLYGDTSDLRFVAQAIETCGWLAAVEGQATQAARLLGAASRMRVTAGVPAQRNIERTHERYVPLARAQLSAADWEHAWSEGYALTPAATRELALEWLAAEAAQDTFNHNIPDT